MREISAACGSVKLLLTIAFGAVGRSGRGRCGGGGSKSVLIPLETRLKRYESRETGYSSMSSIGRLGQEERGMNLNVISIRSRSFRKLVQTRVARTCGIFKHTTG